MTFSSFCSAQCPSLPPPYQFVHSQTLHPPGTSKFRLRPEALFSFSRAHCVQKTSQSRPLCRILLWDLITDWQLSFFSVFKIMHITAFFACIFSCVLFSSQDLFVVIHARACSRIFFAFHVLVQLVPFLLGVQSPLPSASYPLDIAGCQFPRWRLTWPAPSRVGIARAILPLVTAIFLAHALLRLTCDMQNHRHVQLFQVMCSGP